MLTTTRDTAEKVEGNGVAGSPDEQAHKEENNIHQEDDQCSQFRTGERDVFSAKNSKYALNLFLTKLLGY